jgi:hypothetical protein
MLRIVASTIATSREKSGRKRPYTRRRNSLGFGQANEFKQGISSPREFLKHQSEILSSSLEVGWVVCEPLPLERLVNPIQFIQVSKYLDRRQPGLVVPGKEDPGLRFPGLCRVELLRHECETIPNCPPTSAFGSIGALDLISCAAKQPEVGGVSIAPTQGSWTREAES